MLAVFLPEHMIHVAAEYGAQTSRFMVFGISGAQRIGFEAVALERLRGAHIVTVGHWHADLFAILSNLG